MGRLLPQSMILMAFVTFGSGVMFVADALTARTRQGNNKYSATTTTITSNNFNNNGGAIMSITTSTTFRQQLRRATTNVSLAARWRRPYYQDDNDDYDNNDNREATAFSSISTPITLTQTLIPGPATFPPKPKIVVLGATGRIGRLVVRQLLNRCVDGTTIVAFCRDYDKACRVLFDDNKELVVSQRGGRKKGPTLQIVQGNLVAPEELPGYHEEDECDDDNDEASKEENAWLKRAQSAAAFYGTKVKDYDNRHEGEQHSNETISKTISPSTTSNNNNTTNCNDVLQEAIRDCTVIINCVGTFRPTNIWTDWISRPLWRLLQKDVSGWCRDERHPYYVNYASTRKVLGLAEREQLRREAVVSLLKEQQQKHNKHDSHHHHDTSSHHHSDSSSSSIPFVPRIRFIRISDLCVTQQPWDIVPLLTNALQSMVFRYHEMTERLLEESTILDTIVLRPGDLIDEVRNVSTTALQVHTSGKVPCPARVGREDVASLAVAAALFSTDPKKKKEVWKTKDADKGDASSSSSLSEAFHYTLAVRWVGENLHPYPPQGQKQDGHCDAETCLQHALKKLRKRQKAHSQQSSSSQELQLHNHLPATIAQQALQRRNGRRRRLKPYGICTAIPVYFFLTLAVRTLTKALVGEMLLGHPQPSWMVPALVKAQEVTTIFMTLLISRIYILQQMMIPIPWLTRQAAKRYITF